MPLPAADQEPTRRAGLNLTRLAWLLPIAIVGVSIRKPTQDNSYLWHIEAGLRQIDLGSVLTSDPFTFTAFGLPWRTQSWLLELAYGWFEGFGALASADLVVGMSALVLVAAIGLRVFPGRRLLAPIGVLWVMWLSLGHFTARPVFPSLAMFAVVALVADHRRLRWTLPLLFWVWASVHGGFIVGVGYLVLQALRHRDRRFAEDALAACVAATFTAHGVGVWEILKSFAGSSANLKLIVEWQAPDLISLPLFPFLLGLIALLALAVWGKLNKLDLWMVIPFVAFAFTANRAIPLAAIALVGFVFPRNDLDTGTREFARPIGLLAAVFILVLPMMLPIDDSAFEDTFPVAASRYLEPDRTFHSDGAGGYLIYAGFDDIFIDDRAELFGRLYERFVNAAGGGAEWADLFDEYDLKQALVASDSPLVVVLASQGWTTKFQDENFTVMRADTAR